MNGFGINTSYHPFHKNREDCILRGMSSDLFHWWTMSHPRRQKLDKEEQLYRNNLKIHSK